MQRKFYFVIIILFFIARLFVLFLGSVELNYDEEIVTQISQQDIPQLISSITVEPHPPGMYLLLKIIPTNTIVQLKLLIIILVCILSAYSIYLSFKIKLLERYAVPFGLCVFYCTVGFFEISLLLKQDAISITLLILYVLFCFKYLEENKNILWLLIFLQGMLLLFSFFYFGLSVLLLFSFCLYFKKKVFWLNGLLIGILAILYYWALGRYQLVANWSRFTWINDSENSFVRSFALYFFGTSHLSFIVILALLILSAFFVLLFWKKSLLLERLLLISFPIVCFCAYFIKLFVRERYSSFIFLLVCLILAWGSSVYKDLQRYFSILLIILFIVPGLVIGSYSAWLSSAHIFDFIQKVNSINGADRIGFVTDHPIFPFVYAHRFNRRLVPMSVFSTVPLQVSGVNRELLSHDGEYVERSEREIMERVRNYGVTRIAYLASDQERNLYYDPHRRMLAFLNSQCSKKNVYHVSSTQQLYYYVDCKVS